MIGFYSNELLFDIHFEKKPFFRMNEKSSGREMNVFNIHRDLYESLHE